MQVVDGLWKILAAIGAEDEPLRRGLRPCLRVGRARFDQQRLRAGVVAALEERIADGEGGHGAQRRLRELAEQLAEGRDHERLLRGPALGVDEAERLERLLLLGRAARRDRQEGLPCVGGAEELVRVLQADGQPRLRRDDLLRRRAGVRARVVEEGLVGGRGLGEIAGLVVGAREFEQDGRARQRAVAVGGEIFPERQRVGKFLLAGKLLRLHQPHLRSVGRFGPALEIGVALGRRARAVDLRVGEEALVAGGYRGVLGAEGEQVLVEAGDRVLPALEGKIGVAEIVENFRARGVERAILFLRVKVEPLCVALLQEEHAQQAGVGDGARLSRRVVLARRDEKFFRVLEPLRLQGGPAAARRGGRLGRGVGGERERLLPERQRVGEFSLAVVELGERLRGVAGKFRRAAARRPAAGAQRGRRPPSAWPAARGQAGISRRPAIRRRPCRPRIAARGMASENFCAS